MIDTEIHEVQQTQSEFGLLDLVVALAENLKLLVLGPLTVGLFALGIGYTLPQSYTSEAILALPNVNVNGLVNPAATATATAQAAAVMVSPLVLDPVIVTLNLTGGLPIQVARKKLVAQVKALVGKDGLLRVETTADTPVNAQQLGNAIIDTWLTSSVPGAEERSDLEKRYESARNSLDAIGRLLNRLTSDGPATLNQPLTRGEAGTSIVAIGELHARYLGEVLSIPRMLKGFSRDVIKQAPTLPSETTSPKKALIAIFATLFTGIGLLIWLFIRQAWRNSARDPVAAEKQARLLAAVGFKNKPRADGSTIV